MIFTGIFPLFAIFRDTLDGKEMALPEAAVTRPAWSENVPSTHPQPPSPQQVPYNVPSELQYRGIEGEMSPQYHDQLQNRANYQAKIMDHSSYVQPQMHEQLPFTQSGMSLQPNNTTGQSSNGLYQRIQVSQPINNPVMNDLPAPMLATCPSTRDTNNGARPKSSIPGLRLVSWTFFVGKDLKYLFHLFVKAKFCQTDILETVAYASVDLTVFAKIDWHNIWTKPKWDLCIIVVLSL